MEFNGTIILPGYLGEEGYKHLFNHSTVDKLIDNLNSDNVLDIRRLSSDKEVSWSNFDNQVRGPGVILPYNATIPPELLVENHFYLLRDENSSLFHCSPQYFFSSCCR